MSSTSVSILVPLTRGASELLSTLESVEQYLQTTGFDFDVRVLDSRDGEGYGAMIRRGAAEAMPASVARPPGAGQSPKSGFDPGIAADGMMAGVAWYRGSCFCP